LPLHGAPEVTDMSADGLVRIKFVKDGQPWPGGPVYHKGTVYRLDPASAKALIASGVAAAAPKLARPNSDDADTPARS
jgi:hypothetical protein